MSANEMKKKVIVSLGACIIYFGLFILLCNYVSWTSSWSLLFGVPLALISWLWGPWVGGGAGALGILLSIALFQIIADQRNTSVSSVYIYVAAALVYAFVGVIVGYAANTLRRIKQTLAEIRILRGILPICARCKKIRNDEGYWYQVEEYIRDHTEAQFSHGFCPECSRNIYQEEYEDKHNGPVSE